MRAWVVLRQLLAATICAVLALPACSNAAPLSSSTPSHIYDTETLSKTRVWGSNEKNLLVSEKQHWGYEKCRWENVGGGSSYLRLRRLRQLDPPNRHDLQQLPLRRRTIRPRPDS